MEGLFLNPNLDSIFMLPIFALARPHHLEPARTRMRIQRIVSYAAGGAKESRVESSRTESRGERRLR